MQVKANGITIEYEEFGERGNPTVLLVMGFGTQMIAWPQELFEGLVDRGFHVVRYDNRDVGLSEKIEQGGLPDVSSVAAAVREGRTPEVPYTIADMAADGIRLIEELGIEQAHVAGASMGGMIVQNMAHHFPHRVRSLTSIMSTSGHPDLPRATKEAQTALVSRPENDERETVIAHTVKNRKAYASTGFAVPDEEVAERAGAAYDRCYYPEGTVRQYAAIIADGDRTERLRGLTVPTLVLHGEADTLIPVEGGKHTAEVIPGARLVTIPGWGHDMPRAAVPLLVGHIGDFVAAVEGRAAAE